MNVLSSARLSKLILVVMVLWGFAMVAPSLYRMVWPLASFGFSVDNDGVVIDTQGPFPDEMESPAVQAGIAIGDRLDLKRMNCFAPSSSACASLVVVLGGSGGLQLTRPGREIDLTFQSVDGAPPRMVHLRASEVPLDFWGRLVLLADTLVSLLTVLAAAYLVWVRPSVVTWGFFLYFFWFNPGQTFTYYALLQQVPWFLLADQFAEALATGAAFCGLLLFALRFPGEESDPRWQRWEWLAPLIGAVLAILTLSGSVNLFGVGSERIAAVTYISEYCMTALVLAVLLLRRRSLHPRNDQRMRWVIAGCAIGLSSYIFAEICATTGFLEKSFGVAPSQSIIGLLSLVQGFFAYFVWTAVRRQRVISVAIPLRHGSLTTLLTLILGVPIVFLHQQIDGIREALHLPEWLWPLVVAPIVLMAMHKLHELAVELADRFFSHTYHMARDRLEHAGSAALRAADFADIDRGLVEEPASALRLTSAAVFREIDGVLLRMEPAVGWNNASLRQLLPDRDASAIACLDKHAPVRLLPDVWRATGLPVGEQAPCFAVPVFDSVGQPLAITLYGPHDSGNDIALDELDMLQTLAENAGRAYNIVETKTLRQEVRRLRAQLVASGT